MVTLLSSLPPHQQPTRFGLEENAGRRSRRVANAERFARFLSRGSGAYFLFADACRFSVFPNRFPGYAALLVEPTTKLSDEDARKLTNSLVDRGAVFALACADEEYEASNRYERTIGDNSVEAWVGRDLTRYLPGLYWHTVLHREFAGGVDLAALTEVAYTVDEYGDEFLQVDMARESTNWHNWRHSVDEVLRVSDGVFSLSQVRGDLDNAKDLIVLFDVLDLWP
jgi:hypothetical protein